MDLLIPDLGLFFWTLLAFLVVLFILRKFAWGPIVKALQERESGIADSIAAAEKVKAEMKEMQSQNESLLIQAREERTQMLKEAKETKDRIINEAKEQAKTEANKILEDTRLQIERQKMAAMTEVKNEIGNLAVEVAEKILRKQLAGQEAQQGFVQMLADEIKLN
ncbi:F0F1 ATP synthase subunit B [Taibaiella koreensis]|uniref:F0F1 ATP synthase subunit B n=1 Tax=Taibaiella koreensis TaxID=1268548 RepID=UPI000E59A3E5|nr:F0F1 ATP synthase subunit B [Taibaiella koreensis]